MPSKNERQKIGNVQVGAKFPEVNFEQYENMKKLLSRHRAAHVQKARGGGIEYSSRARVAQIRFQTCGYSNHASQPPPCQ
jgi:hypothetical protein